MICYIFLIYESTLSVYKYPRPNNMNNKKTGARGIWKEHIVNMHEHIFSCLHYAHRNYTFKDIIILTYHNYTYKRDILNILSSLFTSARPKRNVQPEYDFSDIKEHLRGFERFYFHCAFHIYIYQGINRHQIFHWNLILRFS